MLTDVAIRALKAQGKPLKKSDSGGLFVLVQPSGKKHWRLAYRYEGKQKLLSGGAYPAVSLADARRWREQAKAELAIGRDPSDCRKEAKFLARAAAENSFQQVAESWLESRACLWSPRYARVVRARLEGDVFPTIGKLSINAIEPPILLVIMRKIESRGSIDMAHRVRNYCGEVFRYGVAEQKCLRDPSQDIVAAMMRAPPVRHRAKVSAKDLPNFFVRLKADEGEALSHLALRWTILTMVRTQETRFAQWDEIEGLGTDSPIWRIPAERMKMRTEHLVPLSPQAVAMLEQIRAATPFRAAGNKRLGKFLFPVAQSASGVISENRMLDVMYRLGFRGKATVHGFRGLASTVLNESGLFEPDWIEGQLAHIPRGVRAVYNSAQYFPHRRKLMEWWSNYLEQAEAGGTV